MWRIDANPIILLRWCNCEVNLLVAGRSHMRSIVECVVLLIGCSSFVSELERVCSCWMDSDLLLHESWCFSSTYYLNMMWCTVGRELCGVQWFGLVIHLIEDRHTMLNYYFKYAWLQTSIGRCQTRGVMWEVRMVVHVFRSCGSVPRSNFTMICGAWCDVCRNDNYAYSLQVARSTHMHCAICVVLPQAIRDM
jgi:hypothetical protein